MQTQVYSSNDGRSFVSSQTCRLVAANAHTEDSEVTPRRIEFRDHGLLGRLITRLAHAVAM